MNKQKWNYLVQKCKDYANEQEEKVQILFEHIFSLVLDYSMLNREIDTHRSIQIGSTKRVVPDIIIRDAEKDKDLFIAELKQLKLLCDSSYKEQLFSYMRLLSLQVGVLVCNAIHVFIVDNDSTTHHIEIELKEDNPLGDNFVELFSKGNFNVEKVKNFVLKHETTGKLVKELQEKVLSLDLKEVVKLYFADNYDENVIDIALNDIVFNASQKYRSIVVVDPKDETTRPTPSNETIQDWIKRIFTYLLSRNILSAQELTLLHNQDYCKRTFGIAYPLLMDKQSDTIIAHHSRYWQKPICGYYICSQWWKQQDSEYEYNIKMWLHKVLPNYVELGLNRRKII